jgi:hypothetical protein
MQLIYWGMWKKYRHRAAVLLGGIVKKKIKHIGGCFPFLIKHFCETGSTNLRALRGCRTRKDEAAEVADNPRQTER